MKKYWIIFLLLTSILIPAVLKAQYRIDTIYYDKNWMVVPHKSFANFYRIALYPTDPSAKNYFEITILQENYKQKVALFPLAKQQIAPLF